MRKLCLVLFGLSCVGVIHAETPLPTWQFPGVWARHAMLREHFIAATRRGDVATMETVCRTAIQLMPGDATWHYNLACALANREDPDLAFEELDTAIEFGFRDADTIAKDSDFSRIAKDSRFANLLKKARDLANKPISGRPPRKPLVTAAGGTVTLSETNFAFNLNMGLYEALLQLTPPRTDLSRDASKFFASQPKAKGRTLVINWLSDGRAAGNAGDIYLNRDRNHSPLTAGDFPQLTVLRYPADAQTLNVDLNHPNALFSDNPVFGNVSRGFTKGAFWRSMARFSFTEPGLAARMDLLYHANQFWVFPCVNDFGKPEIGDVFPANAPFQFVSLGASWSDQPFLRAALAASASFPKSTKTEILKRRLMGPTIQWLLRRTQRDIASEEDYLSSRAHPTAFDAKQIDLSALVRRAHALTPDEIPPAASLVPINSRMFPIRQPIPGRSYPDSLSELLFATSSAISYILRAPEGERTFMFRATPFPADTRNVTYTWRVIHGDPAAVRISAPMGEQENCPETGFAQIIIDRRRLVDRIDIACFAKTPDTGYGAPSIISFNAISQEKRIYGEDGKIESIDYSNPDAAYCDPQIALPRKWKDTYTYSSQGRLAGFTRTAPGREPESFTREGERIVEKNPDGTAKRVVRVKYIPRQTGNAVSPVELIAVDDGDPHDSK